MVSFQFTKAGSPALDVIYKTDLIPAQFLKDPIQNFTVLEVEGLTEAEQYLHGISFNILPYNVADLIAFADTNAMTLKAILENDNSDILVDAGLVKPSGINPSITLTYNWVTKALTYGALTTSTLTGIAGGGVVTNIKIYGEKTTGSYPATLLNISPVGVATTFAASANITVAASTFAVGDVVRFSNAGGALPAEVTAGVDYYVIATGLTATNIQVSATLGGAAITMGGAGTGTHTTTWMSSQPVANVISPNLLKCQITIAFGASAVNGTFTYNVPITLTQILV